MKPHHVSILAAMQDLRGHVRVPESFTVQEIAQATGMTTMRIRNALREMHYQGYLVVPAERKQTLVEIENWRLSKDGVRLVEAMRRHFRGE